MHRVVKVKERSPGMLDSKEEKDHTLEKSLRTEKKF